MLPYPIINAIEALSILPGIGSRSAERLVFSLLKNKQNLSSKISKALIDLTTKTTECQQCYNFATEKLCNICTDYNRQVDLLCVIETPMDLIAIERTHEYKGSYHVLHGIISPLDKINPDDTKINQLIERVSSSKNIKEIVLALNASIEGEATMHYITEKLKPCFLGKITHLARGIPSGGDLDYLDLGTLTRAIIDRNSL